VSPNIFEIVALAVGVEIGGGIFIDSWTFALVAAGVQPFETVQEYCPLSEAETAVIV
jgi:hypothetical protein